MAAKVLMMDVDGVLVSGRPTDGRHLFTELEADLGLSPDRLRETFFTEPADIVLVDDTLANVEAARRAGWSAVHWTSDQSLAEALSPYLG